MKKIEIKKGHLVEIPASERFNDAVAVQLVAFTVNFFGNIETFTLDTKIDANGKQTVIDGNGWISTGYEIN